MRLLHTSDWHLGMMIRNGISYAKDQKYFIDAICKIARDNNVDGIIIAGDVFDKSIASQEALKLYDDTMTYICEELDMSVYIVAGNHDGAERLSSCNRLLYKSGLYISGSLTSTPQIINKGDVDIFLLPWITTDKVKTIYADEAQQINSLEDAYRVVLDKYRAEFVEGHKNILVAHAFITNAKTSVSDRSAEVGSAAMVGAALFEGFDYVALGHLHGPQQINNHMRYSGTPMPYAFGKEEKQEKSVTIFDTETMEQTVVPVPLLHKRNTLSGTFEELIAADYGKDIVDGYVRLEVTDCFVGLEVVAGLREVYCRLIEVSGKSLEKDDAKITMTLEEFDKKSTEPEEIFKRYCEDILEEIPGEHYLEMFRKALGECEKEDE